MALCSSRPFFHGGRACFWVRLDYSYASLFHTLMCTKYSQLSAFEKDSHALLLDDPGSYGPAKLPIHHQKKGTLERSLYEINIIRGT